MWKKRTPEEQEKRDQLNRLVVEGWNGGLTGGALAGLHGITRNAVIGIIHRAKAAGQKVRVLEDTPRDTVVSKVARRPGRPSAHNADPGVIITVPPVKLEGRNGNQHTWKGVNFDTRAKLETVRNLPAPIVVTQKPSKSIAEPSALLVPFMDLQEKAGCRYSLDAKLFCNAPGFPYCPEHKAIVNPPEAQRGGMRKLVKNYGGWV